VQDVRPPAPAPESFPPQATTRPYLGDIPFHDIDGPRYPDVFHVFAPPSPWERPITPPSERYPVIPDTTTEEDGSAYGSEGHVQYPSSALTFTSPGSSCGESVMDFGDFMANQHAPEPSHQRNTVVGKASGPPNNTQQIDWSGRPSIQVSRAGSGSVRTSSDGRMRRLTMGELNIEL
jgi:hypothetical protein